MATKNESRPPIVAVLGHVDHGKTTLISQIKKRDLAKKEYGGISQHLGTYQIDYQGKKITLIDTPGHIVFSQMRSRGAQVADLAVLVVAANEGVKAQTLESLKYIQEAKIPYLVAINKIDLPGFNLDLVKKNLAENNILVEGFGGDVVAVPISAKTGQGVDQLMEMILLLAEMAEVKTDREGPLEAVVIESRLDSGKGPVATVLVRNGQLKVGQPIIVDKQKVKVKAMFDESGHRVSVLLPGQAAEVIGFAQVPIVGSPTTKEASKVEKKIKIILKTDVFGMIEAISNSLPLEVQVIQAKTGNINESDVLLASTTGAEIIGFNVKVNQAVKKLAQQEGIKIKTYKIIYEIFEELEKRLQGSEQALKEEVLGQAEILAEFKFEDKRVAGCQMKEGKISRGDKIHLQRERKIMADCRIKSMQVGKMSVEKVEKGEEFGVILSCPIDFSIKDMLISYRLPKE